MTDTPTPNRPGRVAISLSEGDRRALRALAERRGEPPSTTAARLVRACLAEPGAILDAPPARRRGPAAEDEDKRVPPWLPASRRAGAIEALRDRYPYELRGLPEDLSADRLVAERVAALSAWRDELDTGRGRDPRDELAFTAELTSFARWLEERGRRRLTRAPGV